MLINEMIGVNIHGYRINNCLKIVISALKFVIKIASNQIPLQAENILGIN
jgi:hypothetical protein